MLTGQARDEWIERNPLRKWRKLEGAIMEDTAFCIGRSRHALKGYENGSTMPPSDVMKQIARLMEVNQYELDSLWRIWRAQFNHKPE